MESTRTTYNSDVLDRFGPIDTLIAGAKRSPKIHRERLVRYLVDDRNFDRAISLTPWIGSSEQDALERIHNQVTSRLFTMTGRDITIAEQMHSDILKTFGCKFSRRIDRLEKMVALAAVRGARRMAELNRIEKAAEAIAVAVSLISLIVLERSNKVRPYIARWGTEENDWCIFYVEADLHIVWHQPRFERLSHGDVAVRIALSQLEIAFGKEPSFQQFENKSTERSAETTSNDMWERSIFEAEFVWNPPLPEPAHTKPGDIGNPKL